jgi:hypothetical protein
MTRMHHQQVVRLENGARVSPVETEVIRRIERAEEREMLTKALREMVAENGTVWTAAKLAVLAKLPRYEVDRVLAKVGAR